MHNIFTISKHEFHTPLLDDLCFLDASMIAVFLDDDTYPESTNNVKFLE